MIFRNLYYKHQDNFYLCLVKTFLKIYKKPKISCSTKALNFLCRLPTHPQKPLLSIQTTYWVQVMSW